MPQAELINAAAGKQQQKPPPPGFEDSTAGSQWLHAVKMAGLAEGQDYHQPADNGQDNRQAWANVQPVATVLLLLRTYAHTHLAYWVWVGLSTCSDLKTFLSLTLGCLHEIKRVELSVSRAPL